MALKTVSKGKSLARHPQCWGGKRLFPGLLLSKSEAWGEPQEWEGF